MTFAAVIWHYWIGVVLMIAAVAVLVATVGGYLARVVRSKYPRGSTGQ